MLVEINLLPQREHRKFAFLLILTCLIALMVLVGAFYFLQINATKNEMASIDRQIEMTRKIADKESKNTAVVADSSSVSQLKNAIKWADEYPIQTIPVMNYLNSLLPKRGFIQNFSYTEDGTISLQIQFDTTREAAYFLNSLNNSDWFEDASLDSLSTAKTDSNNPDAKAGNTTTTQNSQTSTTAPQTNPDGTPSNSANQSTGTTDQSNTAGNNISNPATGKTTGTSTTTENPNILPRYIGQYELKLNKETIKKIIQKSKNNGEGVTGS